MSCCTCGKFLSSTEVYNTEPQYLLRLQLYINTSKFWTTDIYWEVVASQYTNVQQRLVSLNYSTLLLTDIRHFLSWGITLQELLPDNRGRTTRTPSVLDRNFRKYTKLYRTLGALGRAEYRDTPTHEGLNPDIKSGRGEGHKEEEIFSQPPLLPFLLPSSPSWWWCSSSHSVVKKPAKLQPLLRKHS